MKKSTLKYVADFLTEWIEGEGGDELVRDELVTARDEMKAELQKGEDKAAANRALYATAHDVVFANLSDKPMTIAEIWEVVKDEMPEGFTKSKLQYAMREYWGDEVIKTEGKVNEYQKRA